MAPDPVRHPEKEWWNQLRSVVPHDKEERLGVASLTGRAFSARGDFGSSRAPNPWPELRFAISATPSSV